MSREKLSEKVRINHILELELTDKHVYLIIGGYGLILNMRIVIDDLWIAFREFSQAGGIKP